MAGDKKSKNEKKNFERNEKENDPVLSDLARASQGLVFISETDAAIEAFVASSPLSQSLESYVLAIGIDEQPIEEISFDELFHRLTARRDWHGPREEKRTKKFKALRGALEKHLDHIRVVRAGRIRIDIYIAGVDKSGRLVGVRTKALET